MVIGLAQTGTCPDEIGRFVVPYHAMTYGSD